MKNFSNHRILRYPKEFNVPIQKSISWDIRLPLVIDDGQYKRSLENSDLPY